MTSKPVPNSLHRWYFPTPWCRKARLAYAGDDCRCLLHPCSTIGLLQYISLLIIRYAMPSRVISTSMSILQNIVVIRLSDVCQAHSFSNRLNSQLTLAEDLANVFFRFFHPYLSIEPLTSGKRSSYEQETFITTSKSKFHLHLSYNDIAEWARMVIKEEAAIGNPPYQLPRFQTPPPAALRSSRK